MFNCGKYICRLVLLYDPVILTKLIIKINNNNSNGYFTFQTDDNWYNWGARHHFFQNTSQCAEVLFEQFLIQKMLRNRLNIADNEA